jgi:transposase
MNRADAEKLYESGREPTVKQLLEFDGENKRLKEKIAQLEKDSKTSSKPPSSDPLHAKSEKTKASARKPGGQPGHKGTYRELIPVEQVNEVVPHLPDQCEKCNRPFSQKEKDNVIGSPFRRQIAEN